MAAEHEIKSRIPAFPGYGSDADRIKADEEIRAYAGERLARIPASALDELDIDARARYDRLLLQSEFVNQMAFNEFQTTPTQPRTDALLEADAQLLAAADCLGDRRLVQTLAALEEAFDRREQAMTASP